MTDVQQAVPVAQIDWRLIAKAAGEHGVRYRTNTAMLGFLAAVQPSHPCKSGEVAEKANEKCADCGGYGEYFGHSPDCTEDNCALAGGIDDCDGQVFTCLFCDPTPDPAALTPDATQTREAEEARVTVAKALARHPDSSWDDYEWEDMASFVRERFLEQADLAIAALNARGGA